MDEVSKSKPDIPYEEPGSVDSEYHGGEEKPRETTEKNLKSFSVEIKGIFHRELYRAFDAFRNAKTERGRSAKFNRLVRLVKNHVESPDLDRVDAGFQMAYSILSFLNISRPDHTELHGRALTLFRDSERTIYERFTNRPEDVLSYIHQVKSSLKDIGHLDEDLDRQKDWWIQELNRHLDHGVLEEKFEIIESPQRVQLALEVDDERWTINYKFSSGPYVFLLIQSEKDPKLKRYVYLENFEEMIRRGEIDWYIRQIKEERGSEDKSRKTLKDYDLPHGKENTLYQMFIPEIYDPIVGSALLSMVAMRALLESKFHILVPEIRFLGHGAGGVLIAFVRKAKTDGYSTVHLDIAQHGSEEGFENFGKPDLLGGRVVDEHLTNPYDLLASLEEEGGIEINLSTIACHGARLVPAYEEYRKNHTDTLSSINIFTQTKPDVVNLVASLNREDSGFSRRRESASSTYYIIFMMEGLSEGMTYGEAVDYADQKSQEVSGLNPESVVHGEVIR